MERGDYERRVLAIAAGARSRAFVERGDYERRCGGGCPCLRAARCFRGWELRIGGGF